MFREVPFKTSLLKVPAFSVLHRLVMFVILLFLLFPEAIHSASYYVDTLLVPSLLGLTKPSQ